MLKVALNVPTPADSAGLFDGTVAIGSLLKNCSGSELGMINPELFFSVTEKKMAARLTMLDGAPTIESMGSCELSTENAPVKTVAPIAPVRASVGVTLIRTLGLGNVPMSSPLAQRKWWAKPVDDELELKFACRLRPATIVASCHVEPPSGLNCTITCMGLGACRPDCS